MKTNCPDFPANLNEKELIDGLFSIERTRWGTWRSTNEKGEGLVTSLTEELCLEATRFYLKGLQEGFGDASTYDGVVGGKL